MFRNKKLIALAGIGNPENFFNLLNKFSLKIEKKIVYPDHYNFKKSEILKIINDAQKNKCSVITTEKDYFRIKDLNLENINYLKLFSRRVYKLLKWHKNIENVSNTT